MPDSSAKCLEFGRRSNLPIRIQKHLFLPNQLFYGEQNMKICNRCGHQNNDDSKRCANCFIDLRWAKMNLEIFTGTLDDTIRIGEEERKRRGIDINFANVKVDNDKEQEKEIESIGENWLMIGFLASFIPSLYLLLGQNEFMISFCFGLGGFPGGIIGAAIGNAIGKQKIVIVWIGAIVGACLGSYLWFIVLGGVIA